LELNSLRHSGCDTPEQGLHSVLFDPRLCSAKGLWDEILYGLGILAGFQCCNNLNEYLINVEPHPE